MTELLPAVGSEAVLGAAVARAVEALDAGLVVVLPTDTVYGVAVDPTRPGATDRLFAAKGRPRSVVLPVLVAGIEDARRLAVVDGRAEALMAAFWPGGLTIVVPRAEGVEFDLGDLGDLGDGGTTIGLRAPADRVAAAVCTGAGPIATTSANLHGQPTPPDAAGVAAQLGAGVSVVLDGGPRSGAPSTVVDCTAGPLRVLREGAVAWAAIKAALEGDPG